MPVRAVLWDMDGTLFDSSVVVTTAFASALGELGVPVPDAAQVIAAYPLGPPDVIMAHLAGRPVGAEDMEAYYRRLQKVQLQPYPGITETLDVLRGRGQTVAVFTGASRRAATMLLTAAGLAVDVLIGGDQVARPKPAADGLLLAAEQLGVDAGDLVYVGDSPADMRAAKAAGSHAAAAAWGHMHDPDEPADSMLEAPGQVLGLLAG